jgi:quinol monooxygenase YgiN
MQWTRRETGVFGEAALAFAGAVGEAAAAGRKMYGLISQITAAPGKRDELARVLVATAGQLQGCLSYIVAADPSKPDTLWVTEVWADKDSHDRSVRSPEVLAAIAKARPLIVAFATHVETQPLGGTGLRQAR